MQHKGTHDVRLGAGDVRGDRGTERMPDQVEGVEAGVAGRRQHLVGQVRQCQRATMVDRAARTRTIRLPSR